MNDNAETKEREMGERLACALMDLIVFEQSGKEARAKLSEALQEGDIATLARMTRQVVYTSGRVIGAHQRLVNLITFDAPNEARRLVEEALAGQESIRKDHH